MVVARHLLQVAQLAMHGLGGHRNEPRGGHEAQGIGGIVQAVQYQGAATRLELKLADGAKLLVSQANLSETSSLSGIAPGQAVMASWSREAMIRLHEER